MHSIFRNFRVSTSAVVKCISSAARKRFYENVFIKEEKGKFFIQLDGKIVKTPLKKSLFAPSKQLASILATEWQIQDEVISPDKMHITALCNTCIDNPRKKTKDDVIEEVISYLHSDTICARIPPEESEAMARMQRDRWDPLLRWFDKRFDVKMLISSNIFGVEQSKQTTDAIRRYLSDLSNWQLAGFQFAVESVKSFVIPMAIIENEISIETGLQLSRLEIDMQTEKWGQVEWHHDIEYENQKGSLAAGILFFNLCSRS